MDSITLISTEDFDLFRTHLKVFRRHNDKEIALSITEEKRLTY